MGVNSVILLTFSACFCLFVFFKFSLFQNNKCTVSHIYSLKDSYKALHTETHMLIYRLARLLVMYEINMFIGMCQLYY